MELNNATEAFLQLKHGISPADQLMVDDCTKRSVEEAALKGVAGEK